MRSENSRDLLQVQAREAREVNPISFHGILPEGSVATRNATLRPSLASPHATTTLQLGRVKSEESHGRDRQKDAPRAR